MSELVQLHCVMVTPRTARLNPEEIDRLLLQIHDWQIIEKDNVPRLEKVFRFKDFNEALIFTNRVGQIADAENHHPAVLTEWGKVTISWWTHAIHGLHLNDFIMAAKTDNLLK
jgi:4a-hydroxytetrahydrobiopterin dehydratase